MFTRPVPGTKFYLLHFDPGRGRPGGGVTLTPLPIPAIPAIPAGTAASDFALSPNGSRLAVVSGRSYLQKLSVYTLASGILRTYRPAGVGFSRTAPITQNSVSWGADSRTLAFVYGAANGREGVRLLDTARPGSGLLANSRATVARSSRTWWNQVQVTADGQLVVGNVQNPYQAGDVQHLVQVSAQTGRLIRVLHVTTHMAEDHVQIHWMSRSGRVLIVTGLLRARHHSSAYFADVDAGRLVDGHYTPLPWSENTFTAAWKAASGPFLPAALSPRHSANRSQSPAKCGRQSGTARAPLGRTRF